MITHGNDGKHSRAFNNDMNLPISFQLVSFGLALLGSILGLIQTVLQFTKTRVRMRVRCYPLAELKPGNVIKEYACVEVANLSAFPITIKSISFEHRMKQSGCMSVLGGACLDGKRLPLRVDPRDAIQVCYDNIDGIVCTIKQCSRVIVKTACGATRFGQLKSYQHILEMTGQNQDESSSFIKPS